MAINMSRSQYLLAVARPERAAFKSTGAKPDRSQCQAESDFVAQDIFTSLSGPVAP